METYSEEYFKKSNCANEPAIGYANYYEMPLNAFLWQYAFTKLIMGDRRGKLLDIGCADGKFIEIMEMDEYATVGIDISRDAILQAKLKNLDVFSGTLDQLPRDENTYDIITAWDLIEHVTEIKWLLSECKRLLKPNGVFVFSTPDSGAKIALDKGEKWVGYTSSLEHVTFFDIDFLTKALKEIFGSKPVICSFTYGDYSTIVGYARVPGFSADDLALGSYLANRSYPIDAAGEIDKVCLLSMLYLHFGVDINLIKQVGMQVDQLAPNVKRLMHRSLILLYDGQLQQSSQLLKKASEIDYKNPLLLHLSLEVLLQYHKVYADNVQSEAFRIEKIIEKFQGRPDEKMLEAADIERQISNIAGELDLAKAKILSMDEQVKVKNIEIALLRQTLLDRESSISWRFSQYYGKYFSQASLVTRFIRAIMRKLIGDNGKPPVPEATLPAESRLNTYIIDMLARFLDENPQKDICLVFSGTKYVENEGQRTLRLAQSFAKKGYAVIFASWRWNEQEDFEHGLVFPSIYQIPIDVLAGNAVEIMGLVKASRKIFLAEFPHPSLFEILSLANANGWITVYDVLDDWASFHTAGQAPWYDRNMEKFVTNNADIITAVSPGLLDKVSNGHSPSHSKVIPNGVSPEALGRRSHAIRPASVTRGSITIGYFGHLTPAWFDWDLIIATANKNPEWKFHIIGYGKPEDLALPDNVIFIGKVSPQKLAEYALTWDVAVIPFKATELSKSVDPIKIYEYLYLELPVVVTGIYHVSKYPYVWIARSPEEFEENIVIAAGVKMDKDVTEKFVSENTWDKRVEEIITLTNGVELFSPLKVG